MGIDINGGMIVGNDAGHVPVPDDVEDTLDWLEEQGMDQFCRYFDADFDAQVWGFEIKSVWREDELDDFMAEIKRKMAKFKELTGADAKIYGMQNVW